MSNMLNGTGLMYFSSPDTLFTERVRRTISKNALWLYLFLWRRSQRKSSLKLTVTGQEIEREAWMQACNIGAARKGLVSLGLIKATKTLGGYCYELCDPECGEPIIHPKTTTARTDFDKLSADQAIAYFKYRLPEAGFRTNDNGLIGMCPFHDADRPKLWANPTLKTWICHQCQRKGKFIHLEMKLAELEGKELTRTEAHSRVCDALRHLGIIDATTGQPEAVYTYCDSMGVLKFEVRRYPGKIFSLVKFDRKGEPTRSKTLPAILYNLPLVNDANVVVVVEGEKDADRVQSLHLDDTSYRRIAATTCALGALKWREEHSRQLRGKQAILIGDNDDSEKGSKHMDAVEQSLKGYAKSVHRIELPRQYKDVSVFLDDCGLHDFIRLLPDELVSHPGQP